MKMSAHQLNTKMGSLRRALVAILVPLPSIVFYLTFLQHYNTFKSSSTTANATTLHAIWIWCFDHPLLLAIFLFFMNVDVLFWIISLIQSSHWMIDLYWTVLPVMLVNYFATHPHSKFNALRSIVMMSLTYTWSIRLSHSYFRRERWQCGAREDWRFTSMRKQYGKRWWWLSFFAVYISQQVLMMGVCLPMYAVHSVDKPWNMWDTTATIICVCGIICAYFADTQLHKFLSKNDELKEHGKPSEAILDKGLWRYSRHPNYFGEQVWWWGLVVFGWNVGYGWTLIGSLMNSLCLAYVTGLVEQRMLKHEYRSNAYQRYQKTTSVWIPWFKLSDEGEKDKNT
ncbi:hypothetical protein AQUCO_03700317v1 [Aquilegia coerulea]|uniref:Uncharacterized protein n=1 Tax=Aquilegia coerulea TaxID=218851 RepID=A0A2G5CUK9_AQUCA|nr:hypothetical protein AQUCO_03700317v1 [Aquilegia coerulea]